MTAKQIFTHPIAIIIYVAGALTIIYGIFQGWFGGKNKSKQQRCAEETGFNLADLDPKQITNTMGMNRDKFDACMAKQPEGDKCHIPNIADLLGGMPIGGGSPVLDGVIQNGKCVGENGQPCAYASEPFYIKGVWKNGKCIMA